MDSTSTRGDPVVCRCGTTCVGVECYKRRSTELVAQGRLHDARNLLEDALQQNETETLREQLQMIYQIIASTARQPRLANPAPVLPRRASSSDIPDKGNATANVTGAQHDRTYNDHRSDSNERPNSNPIQSSSSSVSANVIPNEAIREHLIDTLTCVICYNLLYDPVTTPCGHTFCNACLTRAIDFTSACPTCRGVLHMGNATGLPVANTLRDTILSIFPDLYENRRTEVAAEAMKSLHGIGLLPIFPLSSVAFPMESFPMHIFEACYRLMLRRIMRGNRKFGLVNVKQRSEGSFELCKVGCVLEVTKVISLPDGRSLIETIGRERFLLGDVTDIDGYRVTRAAPYFDDEDSDEVELHDLEDRARKIVNAHLERVGDSSQTQRLIQRAGPLPIPSRGCEALGLWLANVLFTEERDRQRLLEMRNSAKRLREIVTIMESRLTNSECRLQ